MAETTPYFEAVCATRALMLSEEDSLAGSTTLSIETCNEFSEDNIEDFIESHVSSFLTYIRFLPKNEQDLLLDYYLLGRTQNGLALIYKTTQTVCSANLRRAVRALTAILMFKGHPSREQLAPILDAAQVNVTALPSHSSYTATVPLVDLIMAYLETRSFAEVATKFKVHRPQIRRAIREAAKALQVSANPAHEAVGYWMELLIEGMSMFGAGIGKKAIARQANLELSDPALLGEFRIRIEDETFENMFISKNRFNL
jgi:hypothetical protein